MLPSLTPSLRDPITYSISLPRLWRIIDHHIRMMVERETGTVLKTDL